MTPRLHALKFDMVLEQGGYECRIGGSGERVTVTLASLSSLLHFARLLWPLRGFVPRDTVVQFRWRSLRFRLRGAMPLKSLWGN